MNFNKIYSPFFAICLSLLSSAAFSQLVVTPNQTALALATKLAGPGITISSPTLTCAGVANGIFVSTATPLTIDSGILLTTGRSVGAAGFEATLASTNNGTAGDATLTTLAGASTYDACVLQFDFIPNGDTVSFNYQFGSEEYNNSTCGPYNDAFAFFISGPGITGTQNMALIPGTTIPVTVNSINNGIPGSGSGTNIANCTSMGAGSPFTSLYYDNTGGTKLTYKGFTTKLVAQHDVIPCNSYHLKIAIADANNSLYDSGVFIEAGSLSTNTFFFDKIDSIGATINNVPHTIAKGCNPATINVKCSHAIGVNQTVLFSFGGTATNGVDYTCPSSAIIPAGDTVTTITIPAITGAATGTTNAVIYLLSPFSCGIVDSITLNIIDSPSIAILTPDTTICTGSAFQVRTDGTPGLIYSWSPATGLGSSSAALPIASPTATTNYTLTTLLPNAGCPAMTNNLDITVFNTAITMTTPDTHICQGTSLLLAVAGSPAFAYSWSPAISLSSAAIQNPLATPTVTTTYTVTATEDGICPSTAHVTLTVSLLNFTILTPDTTICIGASFPIRVQGTPVGPTYSWTPATGLSSASAMQPTASPLDTISYTLSATWPGSGCPDASGSLNVYVINSTINLLTADTTICYGTSANLRLTGSPTLNYTWTPADGLDNNTAQQPTATPQVSTDYTVTAVSPDGLCTSVASVNVYVAHPDATILIPDTTVCIGATVHVLVAGDSTQYFSWAPPIGLSDVNTQSPFAAPEQPETYELTVTVPNTPCYITRDVTIYVRSAALYNVTTNQTIPYGSSVQLNADSSLFYSWTPNDGTLNNPNINNPVATPLVPTTYMVNATDINGCRSTASVNIDLTYDNIFIPDAFSPNNDALNDYFRVGNMGNHTLADMSVYNRWGNLVYHAQGGETQGWDGKFNGIPQDMGTYNYMIVIGNPDGTLKYYKGSVTLVR